MNDKELILQYAAALYNVKEPKCTTLQGSKLKELAAQQLVKYINWLEKEANKL